MPLSLTATDCGDDDTRPEPAPVFSEAPSFFFELTGLPHQGERLRRARSAHPRRIKDREVLAHNLVGRISFDLLGAHIPARHVSVQVKSEYGIFRNRFDRLSELLSFPLASFRPFPTERQPGLSPDWVICWWSAYRLA